MDKYQYKHNNINLNDNVIKEYLYYIRNIYFYTKYSENLHLKNINKLYTIIFKYLINVRYINNNNYNLISNILMLDKNIDFYKRSNILF